MRKALISVVGPTAVGKTKLAIEIAHYFGTEIISADSRQCYREMNIGTAKPSAEELRRVKHHFINSHSIDDFFSAGAFEKAALAKLDNLFSALNLVVMVGGSGLYVEAVTRGLANIPKINTSIRTELVGELNSKGLKSLFDRLSSVDPEYAPLVDKQNPQRIIRALEVFMGTGKPYSFWRSLDAAKRDFEVISIGLELDREELYKRIDRRMDLMIDKGLFNEADALFQFKDLNSLQTVGYKEIFNYKLGKYDYDECIRLLKRNSRRYAKRQLTWFKKNEKTRWFSPNEVGPIRDFIETSLKN
ncbi:MAG: tRNA (adenosine(37)-N6)-dimethylallyltransferase MiaA [Bacteroidota bacterium]